MAIFHLSIKIVSRSSGKGAVAAAAYRAGVKLEEKETGYTHDYTRKRGVIYSEIFLPANAPQEYQNREILWNEVQKVEKKSDAQLAREIEVALPVELSREEQITLLQNYIAENFTSAGMCADMAIHEKHVDGKTVLHQNPHAHILLTTRGFKEDGSWAPKEKKTYALDENGERIPLMDENTGFHEADSITDEAKSSSKQIIENAEEKAKKLIREAEEEVDDLMDEKDTLINGKGLAWGDNTPYEDWPMEALKQEREFFLEGTPGETDVDNMSLPQLKVEYNKWGKKYDKLVDGYDRADGTHILGYNELVKRHKELMEEPARLLQTDAGKKIIDDAKEEIVQTVYQKIMHDIMGFVETYIFGTIKRHLVEPLYKAIDEMMYGHSFKLNDNDRKILQRAINSSVDEVTEEYSIGKRIEENVRDNMPSISLIEKEVQEQIQRRPRMHR